MPTSKILLALTVAALAGSAALALPVVHHPSVRVPDGGTEQIFYTGDSAPQIVIPPDAVMVQRFMPGVEPPFAKLDLISAEMRQIATAMGRQMTAAMRNLEIMPIANANHLADLTIHSLPAGAEGYSLLSILTGNTVCTQEVQIINLGNGAKPRVISRSSGNCAGASAAVSSSSENAPALRAVTRLPAETGAPRQHI